MSLLALFAACRSYRARMALRHMARIDERLLSDIGLSRSDIADASRLSIWDDPADLLARRRAERAGIRLASAPRRRVTEIDPETMARAERVVASIQSRARTC